MKGRLFRKEKVRPVQGQVSIYLVGGYLMVPADAILPAGIHKDGSADDIRFLGFVCKYKDTASLMRRQWVMVTATFEWEYSDLYGEKGPVLRATEVAQTSAPKEDLVYF